MKKPEKKPNNTKFSVSIVIIFLAAIIIGFLSPTGMFRSLITFAVFYLLLNFHSVIHPIVTPIFNFLHKAGATRVITTNVLDISSISTVILLLIFMQVFIINYIFNRYVGTLIFDPFSISFWIMLYVSNITYDTIRNKKITEFKIGIIPTLFSLLITVLGLQTLKTYPGIVHIPESYMTTCENIVLGKLFNGYSPIRYQTRL